MTNLARYGAGLLGDLTDLPEGDLRRFAEGGWHARVTVNFRNGVNAYRAPLKRLIDAGVSSLPILFWTGGDNKACAPGHPTWNRDAWAARCAEFGALLDELGRGAPQQVEIWNEPNAMAFWPGTARSAGRYVEHMLQPAVEALPPGVSIVCGGLAFRERVVDGEYRNRRAEAWVADFVRNGGHNLVHRWSIHPYGRTNSEGKRVADDQISAEKAVNEIRRFKRKLNELDEAVGGVRKAVWVTETGLSIRHSDFNQAQQRMFLRSLVEGVEKAGGLGVRAWSNWPLRDPFFESPDVYYSGLFEPGVTWEGTGAKRKLAGDYWHDLAGVA